MCGELFKLWWKYRQIECSFQQIVFKPKVRQIHREFAQVKRSFEGVGPNKNLLETGRFFREHYCPIFQGIVGNIHVTKPIWEFFEQYFEVQHIATNNQVPEILRKLRPIDSTSTSMIRNVALLNAVRKPLEVNRALFFHMTLYHVFKFYDAPIDDFHFTIFNCDAVPFRNIQKISVLVLIGFLFLLNDLTHYHLHKGLLGKRGIVESTKASCVRADDDEK
mmetsp:Transcript_5492/g.8298  ORF Transcript_5492/g.8298 Transcript_5492/m.8298 type:complete len:220 (-) Transcript_5492:29-688(-)